MKTTVYNLKARKLEKKLTLALVGDLHDSPCDTVLRAIYESKPDIVAVTGDLTSRLDCEEGKIPPNDYGKSISHKNAFRLLSEAAQLAPTYYSLGNHELCGHKYKINFGRRCLESNLRLIKESGAVLLDDTYADLGPVRIGGLTSGMTNPDLAPKTEWLGDFESTDKYTVLLCHHPEYFPKYLRSRSIDLTLSGHAHGGQIRLFGRGLFAPGQGILPKYTSGAHENRFVVTRGLCNTAKPIPRLFNPTELVIIKVDPEF